MSLVQETVEGSLPRGFADIDGLFALLAEFVAQSYPVGSRVLVRDQDICCELALQTGQQGLFWGSLDGAWIVGEAAVDLSGSLRRFLKFSAFAYDVSSVAGSPVVGVVRAVASALPGARTLVQRAGVCDVVAGGAFAPVAGVRVVTDAAGAVVAFVAAQSVAGLAIGSLAAGHVRVQLALESALSP